MAGPVGTRIDGSGDFRRGLKCRPGLNPQEQNATIGVQHRRSGQLAKILVERQADAPLANRKRQYLGIGNARRRFPNPHDVMTAPAKLLNEIARDVLVAQPAHRHAALG